MENLPSHQQTKPSTDSFLSKILREYPKIRTLKNFVPIEQALARCFILVGIPAANYPKGVEKDVLIDHIIKSYPGYVAPEIIKAFEMAVNREYHEVDYDVLLKHYGTFSAEYLGRIMTVYTEQHRNKILSLKANVTPMYKQPEFDRYANWELGFFSYYDKYKKTNVLSMLPESCAFHYDKLVEMGLIVNTKKERQAYWDEVKKNTPKLRGKRISDPIESDKDHQRRLIIKTKKAMLEDWFKSEAFNDTDIRALITPLIVNK